MKNIDNFIVGTKVKCNTIGHKSAGLIGVLTEICNKPNLGYGFIGEIMVNLYQCEDLTTYWKMRNGKSISIDDMDLNHLRNTLKMIVNNSNKHKVKVIIKKQEFKLNGDIANDFNETHLSDEDDDRFDEFNDNASYSLNFP